MSDCEVKSKRRKVAYGLCIICKNESPLNELTSPQDEHSWKTLTDAAVVRNFEPINKLAREEIPNGFTKVHYHRKCRSDFTHRKALTRIQQHELSASDPNVGVSTKSSKPRTSSGSRVYEKVCIFCLKATKYSKGTNSREPLTKAVELRADQTVRNIATERSDERIMGLTSRDIVAAEAHYHTTCYRNYTRPKPEKPSKCEDVEDSYAKVETAALNELYNTIRCDLFSNPRVVPLADFAIQVTSFMTTNGIDQIKESTKTHLRRKLESEFKDSLHFFTVNRRVYVRPDNLSAESIATENIHLKSKLRSSDDLQTINSRVKEVAMHLHKQIRITNHEQSWPPQPQDLNSKYITIPENLSQFLTVLLGGKEEVTARINRLTWSIAQDIIYAVTGGQVQTPKHTLLPWVSKTLTGNVELIKILNRLGHSISYSQLEEIDTALCMEKICNSNIDAVPLPSNIHPRVPTVLAFDNIDRREEVLSGAGTSHRVNGIIVQPTSLSCTPPKPTATVMKRDKKRSIQPTDQTLPIYTTTTRKGPPAVIPADLSPTFAASSLSAHHRNLLWMMVRRVDTVNQKISSWTGFNILTRDHIDVSSDSIGYLPTINAPATEMSTVHEILCQAVAIKSSLNTSKIVVVLDQALFAKATEIVWNDLNRFGSIVLMMGNFHIVCNLMSIIGKVFGDAGLRDIAVESGVIADGSIMKVMEGKHYNRSVRFHKIMYEALMRIAWASFPEWVKTNHPEEHSKINDIPAVAELHNNVCHVTHTSALNDKSCNRILNLFMDYLKVLRHERGTLSAFWMTYIELVEILLGLLRADREGDWYLHLSCIREMIPWCFAMDKINYARYLPVYYAQMTHLKDTCPELHDHIQRGGFSVQLRHTNPFGRIAVDQATEETVNKDTQTAGGTRGFSLKPGTVSRYYLTAEHRTAALRQLREQISGHSVGLSHPDLQSSRITRDESDVHSVVDLLQNNWTNPFHEDPADLINISTGISPPPDVCDNLLKAREKGEAAYQMFQEHRLKTGDGFYDTIKKQNIKTFSTSKRRSMKTSNKEIILRTDRRLFGNMVLIAQNRKLEMQDVFCYPLGPLPWALANADGTMKKTNKSALSKALENNVLPAEVSAQPSASIIDAMALIHKVHGENLTFEQLSDKIFNHIIHAAQESNRIDVIFDVYHQYSIKTAERETRASREGITFHEIRPSHKIKNWRRLLMCTDSKNMLTKFLVDSWKNDTLKRKQLGNKIMFVTCGDQCFKLTHSNCATVDGLSSTQEEADTRILLHANHAAENYPVIMCISDDTDVFILCLALSQKINSRLFIRRGTKTRVRLVDITKLAATLGEDVCTALLGLHAWTGCDSVEALAGQGKLKALKLVQLDEKFRKAFSSLGSMWTLPTEVFNIIQEFTCKLYCRNTKLVSVNDLRYQMFRARGGDIESEQLPPCENTLLQHTLRANFVTAIWRRSLESSPKIPDPTTGHGWTKNEEGYITIQWMTISPAPGVVLELLSCKCPRACKSSNCTCIQNGLKCTPACKLTTCSNMADDHTELLPDAEDSCDSCEEI